MKKDLPFTLIFICIHTQIEDVLHRCSRRPSNPKNTDDCCFIRKFTLPKKLCTRHAETSASSPPQLETVVDGSHFGVSLKHTLTLSQQPSCISTHCDTVNVKPVGFVGSVGSVGVAGSVGSVGSLGTVGSVGSALQAGRS